LERTSAYADSCSLFGPARPGRFPPPGTESNRAGVGSLRFLDKLHPDPEETMPNLTVTEKEHWKERIARRIDKRIEALTATEPAFLERMREQARQRALQSLGLAAIQAELDAPQEQKQELERRERQAQRALLAAVRRVPLEAVDDYYPSAQGEVTSAIQRRQSLHEDELLAENPLGQQILRLRQEKENLLDTIWLATSPQQIKELWKKVVDLLGEEQTTLQKEALALADCR
jgi:hypothetical protein